MTFYTVEDRVLDAYIIHMKNDIGKKNYNIPKSVLNKKLSVYIAHAKKFTVDKNNHTLRAYYFDKLIIHTDELTLKIFYITFSTEQGKRINYSKVRKELNSLGINREGNGYRKDYYVDDNPS